MVLATWRVSEYKHWMDGTEGTGILTRNPLTGPTELPSRQRPNPTYREQKESEDDSAREIMENKVQKKVAEGNRCLKDIYVALWKGWWQLLEGLIMPPI